MRVATARLSLPERFTVPTINQLASVDTLAVGDQFPVYSSANGDARKASGTALLAFIEANFASPDYTTVLVAPTVSGFVQPIGNTGDNVWLIINAATDFAAGTVQLPPATSAIDGQQVLVVSQNALASVSVTSAGADVQGFPTSLGDYGFFAMRYSADMLAWYCVAQVLSAISVLPSITLTSDTATIKDVNGQTSLELSKNYAGVTAGNFVRVTNRATGSPPGIAAAGVDTNVGLNISAKGSGAIDLTSTGVINISAGAGSSIFQGDTVTVFGNVAMNVGGDTTAISANATAVDMSGGAGGVAFGRTVRVLKGTLAQATSALSLYADDVGARATITDATVTASGNFGAVITGGGANIVPAYHDGANWRIG